MYLKPNLFGTEHYCSISNIDNLACKVRPDNFLRCEVIIDSASLKEEQPDTVKDLPAAHG
ncbi:MAG: hypothetical protein A2V66_00190 [Ignavibacteria bacterium RBG_13_36_8]|nr:MAG: hypothetical protein A2V66_00190 [Ignavibacteria bacterium RBG_13_36_8]